jgi:peptidoglycan LD-endopeptidase CwlK
MSVAVSPKVNINLLYPSFAAKVAKLLELCKSISIDILITDGLRNKEEQDKLYAKGRTESGKIVTNAKYPDSAHNWGIAIDFCQNIKGQEYTDEAFFRKVGEFAESLGFEWAGRWKTFKELCHLQDKDFDVKELKSKYGTLENFLKTWSGGQ